MRKAKNKEGLSSGRLFWLYWVPLILYCLIIFIQSSYPSPKSLPDFPFSDKVMHFAAYAIMGALFLRALKMSRPSLGTIRMLVFSSLFTTLYGVGDEIHQSFVMSRMADHMDVLADFIGGTFGAVSFFMAAGGVGRRDHGTQG